MIYNKVNVLHVRLTELHVQPFIRERISIEGIVSANQGRPVNVKHGTRCAMGKVEDKNPKRGNFNVLS